MPWSHLTTGAKVTLGVLDARQVGGSVQTLVNSVSPDKVSMKPESILHDASNAVEGAFK
jgi:hypothetical protein